MLRPKAEIAEAARRLDGEPRLTLSRAARHLRREPISLNGVDASPAARELLRWGLSGRRGVYLDVLWCRDGRVWVTSLAALDRFARDVDRAHRQTA